VREAAINALKIDNDDAEAHVYLGEAIRILDWDMDAAAREFCRAVALDPNSTPSNYFSAAFWAARGERQEALTYLRRTARIDPASLWVNNSACELYRYFGLYEEANAAGERALQLDPAFIYGEPLLAALYREMGRFDDAIALYEKAQNLSGRPAFGLAITYARMERHGDARRVLEAATANRRYTPGDAIAHVRVALGERDEAIRELERACDEHSSSLHFVGIAPEFVPLRDDQRFSLILRKIGLEPQKVFAAAAA
jgi:tetratricopeptide (TPR) repeat protein